MVKVAAQYRRALEKKLRCTKDSKTRILSGFDNALEMYLEEHAEPTLDDLYTAFGPPEEMANILKAEITPSEHAQFKRIQLFKVILSTILAVVFLVFSVYIWIYKEVGLSSDSELNEIPNNWAETSAPIEEDINQ